MRRLTAEERRLWDRFAREVRRFGQGGAEERTPDDDQAEQEPATTRPALPRTGTPVAKPRAGSTPVTGTHAHANTLDAGWDKRLAKGVIAPDRTIDLHGHTLATAHAELDRRLSEAVRSGARLVLLITGRPARDNPRLPPTSRGVIRASVMDWIAAGGHSAQIAAVRNAHPRHGGAGALYLILRRGR